MKVVFSARGLPVGDYRVVLRHDWDRRARGHPVASSNRRCDYPMFVKPANLGSSVGISKAKIAPGWPTRWTLPASFDRKIVVEAAVPEAREIECAVLGNDDPAGVGAWRGHPVARVLRLRSQVPRRRLEDRHSGRSAAATVAEVQRLSIAAFQAIDCAGMARVDFLLSRRPATLFVNEVNTIPGFTTISMYSKLWAASGVAYPTLLDRLIALALERHAGKQLLRTSVT